MDTAHFKNKLETEKKALESELGQVGLADKTRPDNWHPAPADRGELDSHDDVADRLEDLEEKEATEANLEKRLRDINLALEKIATETYGTCEIGKEKIENDRLEVNPAARTCKQHLGEEDSLV